jgi:D-citramalate synthase
MALKQPLKIWGCPPPKNSLRIYFCELNALGIKERRLQMQICWRLRRLLSVYPIARPIQLQEVTVVCGDKVTPTASVRLKINGKEVTGAATGVGPVDAAINAVRKAISDVAPIQLEQYHVEAITGGTDAMVEVVVRLRKGDRRATAIGLREDIVMASIEAVISGMNVLTANYKEPEKKGKRNDQNVRCESPI